MGDPLVGSWGNLGSATSVSLDRLIFSLPFKLVFFKNLSSIYQEETPSTTGWTGQESGQTGMNGGSDIQRLSCCPQHTTNDLKLPYSQHNPNPRGPFID